MAQRLNPCAPWRSCTDRMNPSTSAAEPQAGSHMRNRRSGSVGLGQLTWTAHPGHELGDGPRREELAQAALVPARSQRLIDMAQHVLEGCSGNRAGVLTGRVAQPRKHVFRPRSSVRTPKLARTSATSQRSNSCGW